LQLFRYHPLYARCIKAFLRFIYPTFCLHCRVPLEEKLNLFCYDCLDLLEFISPDERCPYCFSSEYSQERRICSGECKLHRRYLYRMGAVFDYLGPASTLIRALKYGNQPYLAKGAAALMLKQFLNLNWPLPDKIIPVPLPFNRWFYRGYNQSELLAQAFSKLIDRPILKALRRNSGDFSQAGLSREQRIQLSSNSFRLIKNLSVEDQMLLLIDDVFTTGTTLQICAETLQSAHPASIYGLTLCRAI
jgi:competence protein ComFC